MDDGGYSSYNKDFERKRVSLNTDSFSKKKGENLLYQERLYFVDYKHDINWIGGWKATKGN